MPVYEYRCNACGRVNNVLVLEARSDREIRCRSCDSADLERVVSAFAVNQTESQRMAEFDTSAPPDESLAGDPRNVGMWAKKRAQELGVDPGPEFDSALEKARSGKDLDDI